MKEIDGSTGGGQLLRTAASLAALTGDAFRLTDVRGSRPEPGLRPQHLAAIRLVASLCDADVRGATLGSTEVTFVPGRLRERDLELDVGTAGSLTLLFDAALPLATRVERPFELAATGGTDVRWAPPVEYLRRVKLPLLRQHGLAAEIVVARTGFYPTGGGRATLALAPSTLDPIDLDERGPLRRVVAYSKASNGLAEASVAERQADGVRDALAGSRLGVEVETVVEYAETASPGSSLVLAAEYGNVTVGFDALGERGRPAEAVARGVVADFERFHAGRATVDTHLADQLLLFLALAGGRLVAPRVTDHVESNAAVLSTFGFDVDIDRNRDGTAILTA